VTGSLRNCWRPKPFDETEDALTMRPYARPHASAPNCSSEYQTVDDFLYNDSAGWVSLLLIMPFVTRFLNETHPGCSVRDG
jgi:hypothetical protein